MATLKITILKAKALKNDKHKIRIAVCHKQDTSYIATRFIIDSLSQFKDGQVVKRSDASIINMKLRNLLNDYQDKLDKIENQELYTSTQLKAMLQRKLKDNSSLTFGEVCSTYIKELQESNRTNYAKSIEFNSKRFKEFIRGDIQLSEITPEIISGYGLFLKNKYKLSEASIGILMRNTKTIINIGVKRFMIKYDFHPFINFKIRSAEIREVDIPLETFNKIRLSEPKERHLIVAHDLFLLSFYLGGINLIDLLSLDFKNNEISYTRIKSHRTTQIHNQIKFAIPTQAKQIAGKWMNRRNGKLDFRYKFSYPNFSRYVTRSLKSLAKDLGIEDKIIFYSARKSFAQYASEIGIPDAIIDYCLGHSSNSRGIIRYYTKIRQKQAEIAINRVIDYVNNPSKYEEYINMRADIMMMKE
ncbi:MAG: tyrosine-type recombinase/integrase [Bacteroidales bacterium]|nr:tyrosine-type recombinase/integrase [Bacteroidales bacterium]